MPSKSTAGRVATTGSPGTALDAEAARLRLAIARLARRLRRPGLGELSPSQLSTLAAIAQGPPARLCDVATRECVSASTLSRLIDHLESRGMVERVRDPQDARSSRVCVTSDGRGFLEDLRRNGTNIIQDALQSLAAADRGAIVAAVAALEKLADSVEGTDCEWKGPSSATARAG